MVGGAEGSYCLVGFWTPPAEERIESFERHYESQHLPLAEQLPGLRRLRALKAAPGGPIHRVVELEFADRDSFKQSSKSAEWGAMAADAAELERRFGIRLEIASGAPITLNANTEA